MVIERRAVFIDDLGRLVAMVELDQKLHEQR